MDGNAAGVVLLALEQKMDPPKANWHYCSNNDSSSTFAINFSTYTIIFVTLIFNLAGYFCMINGPAYDRATKTILVSKLTANIFGIYSVGNKILQHDCNEWLDLHLVSASMILSISHLLLISVVETERVFNRSHKKARSFTSFLVLVWFISPLTAFLVSPSDHNFTRVFTAITHIVWIFFIILHRMDRVKSSNICKTREKLYNDYFLRGKRVLTNNEDSCFLQRKHGHLIFIAEITFMFPWILNELFEGINKGFDSHNMQAFATILYSISFISQPLLCVFVTYKQYVIKKEHFSGLLTA